MLDKSITNYWKEKMTDSLYDLYKDRGISIEYIKEFVNETFNKNYQSATGKWRNIYKFQNGENDINNICEEYMNDGSIISANGSIFYNYKVEPSPVYDILTIRLAERKKFKDLMLKMVELGKKREEKNYDRLQYAKKAFSNSIYGGMTMSSGFLSNCDAASAITLQARQLSTEMLWDIERFLTGNISLYNTNELMAYIHHILNKPFKNIDLLKDLSYIPTVLDCEERLHEMLYEMNGLKDFYNSELYQAILTKIHHFTVDDRIKFYYKDNLLKFFEKNKIKFKELWGSILANTEEFLDPYKIPDSYMIELKKIWEYCDNFVFSEFLSYKRVEKYIERTRKCILMSDTDSIMICLDELMNHISFITDNYYDYKVNMSNRYKLVNSIAYLLGNVCDVMCLRIGEFSNVDPSERHRLKMKNEFFFMRMLLFPGVKKNYVTLCTLREGRVVPEKNTLQNTGMKLTSSNIRPEIKDRINRIIKEYMLKPMEVNPIDIWKEVLELKRFLTNELLNGNKKYALYAKYKGMIENYKDPTRIELVRAVVLWNRLYPEYAIEEGSAVYKIKTKIKTLADVEYYIKDPEMKEKVYDLVFDRYGKHRREFKNQDFSRYGLTSLAINSLDNYPAKIPEWIIPAMDVEFIIDMHLRALLDLISGVGLHQSKLSSQKKLFNTLINF